MSNWIIYEAIQHREADAKLSESSEVIVWSDLIPIIGDRVSMQEPSSIEIAHPWQVVQVHSYQHREQMIYLAMVQREGAAIVPQEEWTVSRQIRRAPEVALWLKVTDDRSGLITYGWDYQGIAPTGIHYRYVPTGQGTAMKPEPSEWHVNSVTTLVGGSLYSTIHLCTCERVDQEAAAFVK